MKVVLHAEAFDPWGALARYQEENLGSGGDAGATAVFLGTMRDFNDGEAVHAMTLEHYPAMTEKYLWRISEEAAERWAIRDSLIIHRVGEMRPGNPIVLIAVWAAHRAAAFDACRYLIEELKSRAPFWKKETLSNRQRWVEHNTPD